MLEIVQVALLVLILAVLLHNAVLERRRRDHRQRALREVVPMADGTRVLVKPGMSVKVTGHARRIPIKLQRVFVSGQGGGEGAADWLINDVQVDGKSQYASPGSIPGDMFATSAIDAFLDMETADPNSEITILATYVGKNEEGVAFYGAVIGEAEHPRETRARKRRADRALVKRIEGKEVPPMPLAAQ